MNLMNEGVLPPDDLDLRDERREVEEYRAQTRHDSEEHETADAIIAEMRKCVEEHTFGKTDNYPGDVDNELVTDIEGFADSLEASIMRERERLRKEMDEAAEHINSYLNEIPINRVPHDWLIRNGYKDESYQSSSFDDKENGK